MEFDVCCSRERQRIMQLKAILLSRKNNYYYHSLDCLYREIATSQPLDLGRRGKSHLYLHQLVVETVKGKEVLYFLFFDALVVNGKNLSKAIIQRD